jgi:hypothetical protein
MSPNRRDFLKTASTVATGALLLPPLEALAATPGVGTTGRGAVAKVARGARRVQPFALSQVSLGDSVFAQKRDRMLAYARGYGGLDNVFAGPDRVLSIFRSNAGLDTKGAQPVGSWENGTGYLRGHYAGHFMSMLAQSYASTGELIFKQKLDYMVRALAECQDALAASARRPTARVDGRFGRALRLTGSPIGLAEHVAIPSGVVGDLRDFTISLWINPSQYERARLSDSRATVDLATLSNGTAIFDFGRPNAQFAEAAQTRMYLTVRASNDAPVPRFAITTSGADGEQRLDAAQPLAIDRWTHLAITRSGSRATFYVDGQPVATNPGMTLSPADLARRRPTGWVAASSAAQRSYRATRRLPDLRSRADTGRSAVLMTAAAGPIHRWQRARIASMRRRRSRGRLVGQGARRIVIAPPMDDGIRGFCRRTRTQFLRWKSSRRTAGIRGSGRRTHAAQDHRRTVGRARSRATRGAQVASKIGDWTHSRLSKLRPEQFDRMWNLYIAGEYGGANDAFASLHALRPDKPEYLTVARYFDNRNVKDPTVAGTDILDGRHANQHIPQFIGYLRVFEQNDVPEYHTAAKNFWDMIVPHRTYSHGGLGVGEILRKRDVIAGSLWSERTIATTPRRAVYTTCSS